MTNKITVKVVSQIVNLEYQGVATRKGSAAASKMRALMNIADSGGPAASAPKDNVQTSKSYTLFASGITGDTDNHVGACELVFDAALATFEGYQDARASQDRKAFFAAVEQGKKALADRYGDRIPNEAVLELANSLRSLRKSLWKHQVITTRTSDQAFPGGQRNRDGSYTTSVKSKTIYTYGPLTDAQLEELKQVLMSQKGSNGKVGNESRISTPRGYKSVFKSEAGNIIFRETTGGIRQGPGVT